MKAEDITKIYGIYQQAQKLIGLLGEIDCGTNAKERKPFIGAQNGLQRARFSLGNILILNGCFLDPQKQFETLDLRDYDGREFVERESGYDAVYNYEYNFPFGTMYVEAVESAGMEFAEIRSARWVDALGNETQIEL